MALRIDKHLIHTNNTLILSEINSNTKKAIPSLRTAVDSVVSWDETIDEVYGGDDTKRLLVKNMDEVMRVFQPAYYFSVSQERVDGKERIVVKHDSKFSEAGLEVPITSETLAFKILEQKGRVNPGEQIKELRRLLSQGRNDYLAAIRSGNPKRMKDQKEFRRKFISRVSEPVITYLLAAEACKEYVIQDQSADGASGDGTAADPNTYYDVDFVAFENGEPKIQRVRVKKKVEITIEVEKQDEEVVAGRLLKDDIRVGKKLLGSVVNDILDTENKENLNENEKFFLTALSETGVGSEVMVDNLEAEAKSYKLLEASNKEQKIKLLAAKNGDEKESVADAADEENTEEGAESGETNQALLSPKEIAELRDSLDPSDLLENVEVIQSVALSRYEGDNESQDKLVKYLHTVTPVGRKENEIALIHKKRRGEAELKGEKGFGLYLDLCMIEATEQSPLVKHFEPWIRKALLGEPFQLESKDAVFEWKKHHDKVLMTAEAIFDDYMSEVAPVITHLMGIRAYFQVANQASERVPKVLVANVSTDDVSFDDDLRAKMHTLLKKMNDYNQEEFERAISVVVAPGLDNVGAEKLLRIADEEGFCVVLSPGDPVDYDKVNQREAVEELIALWSKDQPADSCYQSAVLAIPDIELLPKGYKFTLGQYLSSPKRSIFETTQSISIPACFSAAGLIARNDDTKFIEKFMRKQGKIRFSLESKWPCVSMDFHDERFKPLWESDFLSEGVISKSNILEETLPFCVFEHSKDKKGQYKKQKVAYLNTLFKLGDTPLPLYEYRQAKYLDRVMRLNFPNGARSGEIQHLFEKSLAGIYKDNCSNSIIDSKRYEISYDPDTNFLEIKRKAGDQVVNSITVVNTENIDEDS